MGSERRTKRNSPLDWDFTGHSAKGSDAVIAQSGVQLSLVDAESRSEANQSGAEEFYEQRGQQQRKQIPQKA